MSKKTIFLLIGLIIVSVAFFVKIQPVAAASIIITSPNGGEQWKVNEVSRVNWTASGVNYVRIYIYDPTISDSGSVNYIYDGAILASQGYYDWTIQQNQLPGGSTLPRNYKIRIDGVDTTAIGAEVKTQDYSDAIFSIVASCGPYSDQIIYGSTSGGIVWGSNPYTDDSDFNKAALHAGLISAGQTATIRKTSAGYLYNFTGSAFNGVTTLPWTTGWCGVTVSLVSLGTTPSVAVTSPNGGGTWNLDTDQTISWTATNITTNIVPSGADWTFTVKLINTAAPSAPVILTNTLASTARSYSFNLASNMLGPGSYKARVELYNNSAIFDESDSAFSIVSLVTPSLTISPTNVYFGETYTFSGAITGAAANSSIYFYLQRPDGTLKYENYYIGVTDSAGAFSGQTTQPLATGQIGTYQSWVKINGIESNKVSFTASSKPTTCFPDGALIKLPDDPKVYIIINCQKKWIKTAEEFKDDGYKWEDVKETSSPVLQAYSDYLQAASNLLRAIGQERVYKVVNGKLLWVPTISAFNAQGLKWSDIQSVPESEINNYQKAKLLKAAGDQKIYYITNSGLKRHILNEQVFNSYNNKWNDVVSVSGTELNAYPDNNLIKQEGDNKVYKLESGQKRWIKTAEAFNRLKYDWNKVAPANATEVNAYQEGTPIE